MTDRERRRFLGMLGIASVAAPLVLGAGRARGASHELPTAGIAYVGGYTRDVPPGSGDSGIHVFATDAAPWRLLQAVPSADPSFLVEHPSRDLLFAVNEVDTYDALRRGSVEAYRINPDGMLRLINRQPLSLSASAPAHAAVSADGRYLLVSSYGGGIWNTLPIAADGALGMVASIVKDVGHGPDADRQASSHPHMLRSVAPHHAIGIDLGADRLTVFGLDDDGHLQPVQRVDTKAGDGPRHMVVDDRSRRLYVINELVATVTVYRWHADLRSIGKRLASVSTLPKGYSGQRNAAAIVLDAAARRLFVSNRRLGDGDPAVADSIAVFDVRTDDHHPLLLRQHWSEGVRFAREIVHDVVERQLYVLNQQGGDVMRLDVEPASGNLARPVTVATMHSPTSLVIRRR